MPGRCLVAIWQAGVFLEPGVVTESILNEGDAGYAPRGSAHYFININETHDAYVVLMFNDGVFTNINITAMTANVPAQVRPPACNGSCNLNAMPCHGTVRLQ